MRSLKGIDLAVYGRSFVMLFRFPQVIIGPLVAGIVQFALLTALPGDLGGGLIGSANASITQLISQLIGSMGLAVALIVADAAWRRDRAPIGAAWEEATRRLGDIFFASIGFGFVVFMGTLIGGFLGGFGAIALALVAFYFFVFTLPAAAIGGIPGSAALQVSLERVRANPLPALFVTILYFVVLNLAASFLVGLLLPLLFTNSLLANGVVSSLIVEIITAVFTGYLAFVLAKVYADLSYGRRW